MEREAERPFTASAGRRAFVATIAVLLAVGLVLFAAFASQILLLTFAGILFAIFLRTPAEWIHQRLKIPAAAAVVVVLLALLGLGVGLGWVLAPSLAEQAERVREELPKAVETLRERWEDTRLGGALRSYAPPGGTSIESLLGRAAGVVSSVVGVLVGLGIFLWVGIFLALNPSAYENGLLRLLPGARRDRGRLILDELGSRLRRWLFGRLIGMAFIGGTVTLGLWILGAPLALSLGLLAAFFSFIPNFGPILGAAPGVLLAMPQGGTQTALVLGLYVVVEALDNNLVTPLIEQKAVYLPPALTILAQMAGGLIFGVLGLLLATPLTACAMILVRRLYVEDVLGETLD